MRSLVVLLVCSVVVPIVCPLAAHDFAFLDTTVLFRADGTYRVDLTLDLDTLALGVAGSTDAQEVADALAAMDPVEFEIAVERVRETLLRRVRLRFDGVPVEPLLEFPDLGSPRLEQMAVPSMLGVTAQLTGTVPEGAKEFTFFASRAFGPVYLTLLNERSSGGVEYPMEPGARSYPYPLDGSADSRASTERLSGEDRDETTGSDRAVPLPMSVAWRYVKLGFTHILPLGLDHILFVLGLFLFSNRWKPLLLQVSAFTVAHTMTLALSVYGIVALPSRWVETLIALSIAYIAIENLYLREMKPWRLGLVFAFGLLHGLGFAGVLRELGLPTGQMAAGLLSFNVGVELGQVSVIALAWVAVGWFRERPWFRRRVVVPASLVIAAIGIYWTVVRAWG